MRSGYRAWAVIPMVFLLSVICGAGQAWAQEPGELTVLAVYPTGEAPRVGQFTVAFNQPMIPLGDMSQPAESAPFQVTPQMAGAYRWLNVYTLVFEPEKPLEGSLQGTITVSAGVASLSGAKLAKPVTVEYSLPKIRVLQTQPSAGTENLTRKPEIRLTFNQPVDLAKLAGLAYFATSKGRKFAAAAIEDAEANNDRAPGGGWRAIVQPKEELPINSNFDLILPPGLISATGPEPSEEQFRFSFKTFGPFKVLEIVGGSINKAAGLDPESGLQIRFDNPILVHSLVDHLKIAPEYDLSWLKEDYAEDETSDTIWIPGPFKPASVYTFQFGPGLKDEFGQALSGRLQWRIAFGPASPVLDVPGRHGVLEITDDPTYPFQVRNVRSVDARGVFLTPERIVPFMTETGMNDYMWESEDDLLAGVPPTEIKTAKIEVKSRPNTTTYEPVRLKTLFGPNPGPGLMYFDLAARETNSLETGAPIYRRAMVQVSNIGLTAKFGQSNTMIWTTDLEAGTPLPDVRVEVRDAHNTVLWRGTTDGEGIAMAPGVGDLGVLKEERNYDQPLLFVMAYSEDRFAMVSTEWDQGIQPWNFGLDTRELEEGPEAATWVLTALPLYKPGEEVNFKVIRRVNTAEGLRAPAEKPLLVHVQDARGKTIEKLTLELNRFGTASAAFTLPEAAPLGTYWVEAGPDEKNMRESGRFRVEEYRKPTFQVELKADPESASIGREVKVNVEAQYHFGAPVKNQPLDYAVLATPAEFSLPRFEDYTIQDWLSYRDEPDEAVPTIASGKLKLDESGRATVSFKTVPAHRPMPRNFSVEATVTDVDQRTVSRRQEVLVHPAQFYLGLKTDKYLVGSGDDLTFSLIAAGPDGATVAGVATEVTVYRRTWNTVRRKGVGGYYHYISEPQDTEVKRIPAVTAEQPVTVAYTAESGGYFYASVKAKDAEGREVAAAVDFYAYGSGSAGWEHYDHDRIDLIADKKEYKPGEKAVIMVKSPFTDGTGLMTVERDGVRRHKLFKIDGASPNLEVELGREDGPNVFVSVVLVRGRISETLDKQGRDPGKPAFKAGYVELKVKDDSRKLDVAVTPNKKEARPGEEIEISLKVTDQTGAPREVELAVIAADAALLQLASEDAYYPEKLFFAPLDLAVWTSDLRLNLIGRRHYGLKGAKAGGGGMGEGGDKFRRRFVSLALFQPHVTTDKNGEAKISFTLPDNLTTFKIFAVAGDDGERFGTGVSPLVVTKSLVLKSALPNFGGVGDTFTAAASLHNRSGQAGQAEVKLSGSGFEILEGDSRRVELAGDGSVEVGFLVRILPGATAVFRFQALMGEDEDAAEFGLPLRYPNALRSVATYGQLTESKRQSIRLPDGADPQRGELSLAFSPSLAGSLGQALDYLSEYPHECLEQTTSRVVGDLAFLIWKDRTNPPEQDVEKARKRIEKWIRGLPGFQLYDGGFTFWPGLRQADPWLSAYVVQVLNYTRKAGFEPDEETFNRGLQYLDNVIRYSRWPYFYGADARLAVETFMVSVLAEAGQPVDGMVENLYARMDDMTPYSLSLLLWTVAAPDERDEHAAAQIAELIRRLFARAVITSGEVHFEGPKGYYGILGSDVRTNALALRALLRAAPDDANIVSLARWLVRARTDGHWGNTQNNAAVLMALTSYIQIMEKDPPDLKLEVVLDGRNLAGATFTSFQDPAIAQSVPVSELDPSRKLPLDLNYQGRGLAYYLLRLAYANKEPNLEPYQAGLALDRTYRTVDASGLEKPVATTFQRGDLVRVEVTLLVPNQRHYVVLEDRLPAGLEPLNFALATAPDSLRELLDRGYRPEEYYRRYWYEHQEIRANRVMVYTGLLPEGIYTFNYLARAVTAGRFIAPGAHAEEMYSPEVSGDSAGVWLEVR